MCGWMESWLLFCENPLGRQVSRSQDAQPVTLNGDGVADVGCPSFLIPRSKPKEFFKIILFSYHHNKINCYELITCCTAHLNCVFFASDHHPQQSKFLPFWSLLSTLTVQIPSIHIQPRGTPPPPFEDFTPTQPISFKLPPHVCNRAQLHIVETRHVPRSVAVDLSTDPSSASLTPFMMW